MATGFREMDRSSFQEDILKASLHWLSIQLPEETHQQSITLLRDPVEGQHWRHQLIVQLTAPPVIYCAVVNSFVSITPTEEVSFQCLFKTLARKGVFLDDCDNMMITEATLSTQHPFSMLAHQTVINALMKLYILTCISIHSVISEVKRVACFTPSKELPSSSNEALSLWVNKISNHNIHKMKGSKGEKKFHLHVASGNILEVVRSGESLAALLHFYLPGIVKWNDIHFSSTSSLLPEDKSLHNLMMVKTIISLNTPIKYHFDPHLLLLSSHVMLNTTDTTALELNIFVFLSSLFLYFKQCVTEQPAKQLSSSSNDDSPTGTKPMTANKLTKRKDLQTGVLSISKPPSACFPVRNSREGLTLTVSDSSLCAQRIDTSSSASSVSLIDFNKNPSGRSKCNMRPNIGSQKITASSESLNMGQFHTHTSLRIKRPPSGQTTKECFVSKTVKSVSFQDDNFADKSVTLSANTSENGFSDHEQERNIIPVVSCSHGSSEQSKSVAIIADQSSYRWLVEKLLPHGVTLEDSSITDNKQQVVPVDLQDVATLIPHMTDNMEDDHSTVPYCHQIISSQKNVRVDNIAVLKVKQSTVDTKPSHCNSSHNTVPVFTSKTISPEDDQNKSLEDDQNKSLEDNQNKSLEDNQNNSLEDNQKKSHGEPDKNISLSNEESEDKAKSQSSPVTTYTATDEDMEITVAVMPENLNSKPADDDNQPYEEEKVDVDPPAKKLPDPPAADADNEDMQCLAMACYETVMEMIRNGDVYPDDDPHMIENNPIYYIDDLDPPAKKPPDPPATDANNEDMQCLAMACYETVMEMIKNGDVYPDDDPHMIENNPIYYLDVEPSHSYELPLYNPSSPQQYPPGHLEKKSPPAEAPFQTACKTAGQQTHSQPLVTEEDTASQCRTGSVDSLVPCSEQTEGEEVEGTIKDENATSTLKDDGYSRNDLGQDDSNQASNHPFATFIDISDAKRSQEHMKKLESRRQEIKMQLMERERTRVKKRSTPHKPKDSISPQCVHTTERDSGKKLQTTIIKKSKGSQQPSQSTENTIVNIPSVAMTTALPMPLQTTIIKKSRQGSHFTLGSQQPSQSAENTIVNIPSVNMPPHPTGIPAAVNAPLVKETEDQPVPIPYNGPLCYVQPQIKSNRKIICNAISHICLAGAANNKTRLEVLEIVENSPENHFLILFRDHIGRKFRGIYSFDDKKAHKIFGAGPNLITDSMISRVYKYNSGSREFNQLPSISFSLSADGFTIHNFIWVVAKNKKHVH